MPRMPEVVRRSLHRASSLALLLVLAALCFASLAPAAAEEALGDPLPDPADYPAAGPGCKQKKRVTAWIGTPAVDWPKTYHCVLDLHTCEGMKTYKSGVRPGGTQMCADYRSVHDALAGREICCDAGAPAPKPSPAPATAPKPRAPRAAAPAKPKYTDCSDAAREQIEKAIYDASLALEFSGCMELHREDFAAWNERLQNMHFVCLDADTNPDEPPCAKAGRPRETREAFSRNHMTIFSRNIASCGCLHAILIHELAHTFDYEHEAPRNAYDLELDCAACGK
jgi:hypothetical protein